MSTYDEVPYDCQPDTVSLDPEVEETCTGYFEPDLHLEISDPATKAALWALAPHWPHGLSWERLQREVSGTSTDDGRVDLWGPLRELHALGQVELRLIEPPVRPSPREYPEATLLTPWEAERRDVVTTATHQRLTLTETDREIVRRLDGHLRGEALVGAEHCLELISAWSLLL